MHTIRLIIDAFGTLFYHYLTGRIWAMVAGGASVVYADTISDLGYGHELANYGEYSGAPSIEHTFEYAKTIGKLMTRTRHSRGKILDNWN